MIRFKNIIDILFTIFVLSVVITDGVIIYIATKPTQFSSCYNTLFFSFLTLFIVSLRYVVLEKSNIWIVFTGVFFRDWFIFVFYLPMYLIFSSMGDVVQ